MEASSHIHSARLAYCSNMAYFMLLGSLSFPKIRIRPTVTKTVDIGVFFVYVHTLHVL